MVAAGVDNIITKMATSNIARQTGFMIDHKTWILLGVLICLGIGGSLIQINFINADLGGDEKDVDEDEAYV
jgi:hypothetical protein